MTRVQDRIAVVGNALNDPRHSRGSIREAPSATFLTSSIRSLALICFNT